MKNLLAAITAICHFCLTGAAFAADGRTATQWDRGHALAAVRSVDLDAAVEAITNLSTLADAEATLIQLQQLETRSDWPLPAREAALFEFTRALAELPGTAVAPGVLEHLLNYEARTLVADEDHPAALVPLFNISGAAKGVENGWRRKEFTAAAAALIGTDPVMLVPAFLQAGSPNQRSGYLDALRQAPIGDVNDVQQAALAIFMDTPELTPVVGLTAVLTGDPNAVRLLLSHGRGAALSSALRQLDQRLLQEEKASLLQYAIENAPAVNASLAIAAWWPGLRHISTLRERLMETLADPELGGAAALALADEPDTPTVKALQQMAKGDNLAARRAQMALEINREQLAGGMRP